MTTSTAGPGRGGAPTITVTAAAFAVTMIGTTLPTPLYSIYAARMGLSDLTITVLFAVYAFGVVATLLLFGRLSDEVGRRPVLLAAVAMALISAVLFLLPLSLPLMIVARVFSGLGAGLMSGAGTAAVIDLFPAERRAAAGVLAVAANTGGLALGTLLSGVVADLSGAPLRVPYLIEVVLAVLALAGLRAAAAPPGRRERPTLAPQRLRVPAELRGAFTRAVLAAGAGFAVTGVLTAVSAVFLAGYLHLASHVLAGFVVFLAFAGMATGQIAGRWLPPRAVLPVGCAGLVLAAGLLALALGATLLVPVLLSAAVLGVSAGLCLNGGIASTVQQVPLAHRGEVSSSLFAGLYAMLAVPVIGVGLLTELTSLRTAGLVFSAAVAVLAAVVAVAHLAGTRPASERRQS